MTPSFNLLDQPWIRVTRLDGTPDEVSLLTVFREASSIGGIHGEIASQDVAILRLLLAICHRTMGGPPDLETWEAYWEDPELLGRDAADYLERYRDRFDLRHPEQPFFQVAGIESASKTTKFHGLDELIGELPKEGKRLFTARDAWALSHISCAEAARWLIHLHAYDIAGIHTPAVGDKRAKSGKSYGIGTGWAGQIGVVTICGDDLHQTLLLNTVVTSIVGDLSEVSFDDDLPPWEREPDTPAGRTLEPRGPVSCYTWQARRALLYGTDDKITYLFYTNGDQITSKNNFLAEPLSAWQTKDANAFDPCRFSSEQAFWRGLPSMVSQLGQVMERNRKRKTTYKQPGIISFYQELMVEEIIPNTEIVRVRGTGLIYEPKKTFVKELVDDVLHLPSGLLELGNERLVSVVKDAMEETEQVAEALRELGGKLAKAAGAEPPTASAGSPNSKLAKAAGAAFYLTIDEEFPRWLASLDSIQPQEGRLQWRRLLLRQARAQADEMADTAPASAIAGRVDNNGNRFDVGLALKWFDDALERAIPFEATATSSQQAERA